MGYPMSYTRVVNRNGLAGEGYTVTTNEECEPVKSNIRGDMRRLEHDTVDERHLSMYAIEADITVEQVKKVFDLFFRY